jgi:hypothetical protein
MPASIIFDQATQSAGVAGNAREDFDVAKLVTCTNASAEASYIWTLIDVPIRSALVRGTTTVTAAFNFTPDVKGTYVISLQVNGSSLAANNDESFCAVVTFANKTLGWRYLGAFEQNQQDNIVKAGLGFVGDINVRGWATERDLQLEQTELAAYEIANAVVSSPGIGAGLDRVVRLDETTGLFDPSVLPGSAAIPSITGLKIANYTANTLDLVIYDPTAGTFQIDAPATPTAGDRWSLKNVTTNTTGVTIDGNGENIENPSASAIVASYSLAGALVSVDYIYDGTNWVVL